MPTITIDHVANLDIQADDHFNEIRTLQTLTRGLHQLYRMVKFREFEFEQRCGPDMGTTFFLGRDFDGTRDFIDIIACFFHWFGVSVCNFTRLVGFIHGLERKVFTRADLEAKASFKTIKAAVDSYLNSVTDLEKVVVWRNKVGAHFAITDPYKDDNIATLDMSVIFPVTFENRYFVGGLTMGKGNSTTFHTSQLSRWSLTEVFESLIPRFWPNYSIPTVEQLRATSKPDGGDD